MVVRLPPDAVGVAHAAAEYEVDVVAVLVPLFLLSSLLLVLLLMPLPPVMIRLCAAAAVGCVASGLCCDVIEFDALASVVGATGATGAQ